MDHGFLEAVKAGDVGRVQAMLQEDPRLAEARDAEGTSAVLLATYYGKPEVAARLLAAAPELNLFEAAAVGKVGRARAILEQDPGAAGAFSHDGWTALHLAAFFGRDELVQLLLAHGADVRAIARNAQANTPLHAALAGKSGSAARRLLAHGADVEAATQEGWRPLHLAAQNGDIEMIGLLLELGAQVSPSSRDGRTPLAMALAEGHTEAAAVLRARGGVE